MNPRNLLHKVNFRGIALRAVAEFLVCVVALFFFGYIVSRQVDKMLTESMELAVSRQVDTLAHSVGQQFRQELRELDVDARLIESQRVTPKLLVDTLAIQDWEVIMGVKARDGTLLAGKEPPGEKDVNLEQRVYRGESSIGYWENRGLMFVSPIFDWENHEATAVLYKLYDNKAMLERFNLVSYGGDGLILLFDETGPLGALSWGLLKPMDVKEFCELSYVRENYDKMWARVQEQGSGAFLYEHEGRRSFTFGAKVPDTDFVIMGNVPWDTVAAGVDNIYFAIVVIFCVLLGFILMLVRYAFLARMRTQESIALREAKAAADSANQAKSEFLSNMSHEIRTPINAVLGMGEMVLRESKEPQTLEYTRNAQNAAHNLLGLVNDILDFSKIEAGKMDIIPVEYELSSLLNDLVTMSRQRAEKKGLPLIVETSPKLPSMLFGDEIRIKQVITNILTNAVKYTDQGSVTLTVNHVEEDMGSILLCVSVRDTGIGIKEEDMKKLFSAFERIEEKRNRSVEGTGLGMNITQQLLHLMGTELHVTSVYGRGSTFSFRIRQKVMNWTPMGDFEEAYRSTLALHQEYHEKFIAPEAKILVVDDTVMNLTVVKGLLKKTKVQIDTAESGQECLALAAKQPYDIIFLDHRMPGMDGMETLKKMQEMEDSPNRDTPVISLTANAISGAREEYIAAGFRDYLTKPIDSAKLESLLIKYLPPDKVQLSVEEDEPENPADNMALPDWLYDVTGIDSEEGIRHCGSQEAYLDALTVFARSVVPGASEIEEYFHGQDWTSYTTKVHALKSTARIIGAKELSERAKRLEDAGNSGYIEEIREATPALLDLYRSYVEKLAPLCGATRPKEDAPWIDESALEEAYDTLREFARSFDYDNAVFVLQSLEEYRLPENEAKRFDEIRSALEKLDWEKVGLLLEP